MRPSCRSLFIGVSTAGVLASFTTVTAQERPRPADPQADAVLQTVPVPPPPPAHRAGPPPPAPPPAPSPYPGLRTALRPDRLRRGRRHPVAGRRFRVEVAAFARRVSRVRGEGYSTTDLDEIWGFSCSISAASLFGEFLFYPHGGSCCTLQKVVLTGLSSPDATAGIVERLRGRWETPCHRRAILSVTATTGSRTAGS